MKVSLEWLKDYVALSADADDIAKRLTMAGIEVESLVRLGEATGVVVAEVLETRKHPNADNLSIVTVTDGGGRRTDVVCGASNVPGPGGRVAWAEPGGRLPQ